MWIYGATKHERGQTDRTKSITMYDFKPMLQNLFLRVNIYTQKIDIATNVLYDLCI